MKYMQEKLLTELSYDLNLVKDLSPKQIDKLIMRLKIERDPISYSQFYPNGKKKKRIRYRCTD